MAGRRATAPSAGLLAWCAACCAWWSLSCAPEVEDEPAAAPPPAAGSAVSGAAPELVELDSGTSERLQAIDPGDGVVLWASGVGGVVTRSLDGGRTWSARVVPGADELQLRDVEAFGADVAYALAAGSGDRSRVFKTVDGGASWTEQWRNEVPEAFYDCFDFWSARRGLVFSDSVDGEMPLLSTADGETWRAGSVGPVEVLGGENGFSASGTCLVAAAGDRAWIGTGAVGSARVLRSLDGGRTWEAAQTPIFADAQAAGVVSLALDEQGVLYAFGGDIGDSASRGRRLARSRDGGVEWELLPAEPDFAGAIYGGAVRGSGSRAELLVVGPGGAAYSPDAGETWLDLDPRSWWGVAWSPAGPALLVGPEGRIARWSPAPPASGEADPATRGG
jgi:photosystem II stability/assembly factor-like uncharacterized protein